METCSCCGGKIPTRRMKILACRGPIEQQVDVPVEGYLMVAEKVTMECQTGHSPYGYDHTELYKAIHDDRRVWLRRDIWQSAPGYTCDGLTDETILSYDDGMKFLKGEDE